MGLHERPASTLRRAVREMLSKHSLVRSHASAPQRVRVAPPGYSLQHDCSKLW